jgi:predicted fused transcriptional regulator/phosphomethylpyrimidine kinase
MIQVREFFTELTLVGENEWEISEYLETQINTFLKKNLNIKEVIDIKYRTMNVGDCIQSSALLIYKV